MGKKSFRSSKSKEGSLKKFAPFFPLAVFIILLLIVAKTFNFRTMADTCVPPTNYPAPPNGGMTYANWTFNQSSLSSFTIPFTIYNDPGPTSDEYLELYDQSIDGTGSYFGVQTIGLALFSRWGTNDLSNIRLGPNAYSVAGTESGPFVSLRLNYKIPVGTYSATVKRAEFDGTGDWFDYYLTTNGVQTYVGGVRFPRANSLIPAGFSDGGGSWIEFWDNNNNTTLYPVPLWHVSLGIPTASGIYQAQSVRTTYSPMPNSDIYFNTSINSIDTTVGGSTPRCHSATTYSLPVIALTPTPTPTIYLTPTPKPTATPTPKPTSTPTPKPTATPTPTTTPISISITSPSNGSTVSRSTTVTIRTSVSSNVKQVSFTANGSSICSNTTYPFSCNWRVPSSRNVVYSLTATGKDAYGNTKSSSISVTSR